MLVRFDHVARFIVNANHSIMCAAAVHRVADCIRLPNSFPDSMFFTRLLRSSNFCGQTTCRCDGGGHHRP